MGLSLILGTVLVILAIMVVMLWGGSMALIRAGRFLWHVLVKS